jgi:hypothetical protein
MLVLVALTGCRDSGLPDRNLPLQEAEQRQWRYPLYASGVTSSTIRHDGADWAIAGAPVVAPARMFAAVGGEGGRTVHALTNDSPPYDRLYLQTDTGWRPYARIPQSGDTTAAH